MGRKVQFEETEKREKDFWKAVGRGVLYVVLFTVAVLLSSRALTVEGKALNEEGAESGYWETVQEAVSCQKELMAYMGANKREQLWYSVQIYRLALLGNMGTAKDADFFWCNELSGLTMEAYENLDKEGKELLTAWQMSREQWKRAEDNKAKICDRINKLYYQQLACVMQ